jgi:hypothetical protein
VNDITPIKFTFGLDQKPDPELGKLQEFADLENSKVGVARSTLKNTTQTSYGAEVHSLIRAGLYGNNIVAGVGGFLYNGIDTFTSAFSGLPVSGAAQSSRTYFTDLTDGMWYYNGTLPMYRAGVNVPGSVPTTGAGGGGGFTGTYNVVCTFLSANGFDGNPVAALPVNLSAQQMNISNIPVNTNADYNIVGRKLWIQGGTTPYYVSYCLLATINDNVTNSLAGLDTTNVTTTILLQTDNNTPSAMTNIVNHYDTFFGFGIASQPNYLAYSKAGYGELWPPSQLLKISSYGDDIMCVSSWDGVLWVFTKGKIFMVVGSPGSGYLATNFYVKETRANRGCVSPRGAVNTPYGIFYATIDGIYTFDGTTCSHFSHPLEDYMARRTPDADVLALANGVYWDNKLLMSFALDGSEVPNWTFIYDFETKTWSTHQKGYFQMIADDSTKNLFCATTTGIDLFRGGSTYNSWFMKTMDFTAGVQTMASFGEYQVDLEGTCTSNLYLDGSLVQTEVLSAPLRAPITRLFPNQLAHRASIELLGAEATTQSVVHSLTVSVEPQRGQI